MKTSPGLVRLPWAIAALAAGIGLVWQDGGTRGAVSRREARSCSRRLVMDTQPGVRRAPGIGGRRRATPARDPDGR